MKAVIYARYSSDNQREESIEGQLRECTAYCVKNDITILRTYIDRALSAKTDNRPDFQRMVKDSAKGLFDVVIVWKLDRFAGTATTAPIIRPSFGSMASRCFLLRKTFPRGRRVSFWKVCWKVWRNTTPLSCPRRLSGAIRKTL